MKIKSAYCAMIFLTRDQFHAACPVRQRYLYCSSAMQFILLAMATASVEPMKPALCSLPSQTPLLLAQKQWVAANRAAELMGIYWADEDQPHPGCWCSRTEVVPAVASLHLLVLCSWRVWVKKVTNMLLGAAASSKLGGCVGCENSWDTWFFLKTASHPESLPLHIIYCKQ